jgi:hypothetical protein
LPIGNNVGHHKDAKGQGQDDYYTPTGSNINEIYVYITYMATGQLLGGGGVWLYKSFVLYTVCSDPFSGQTSRPRPSKAGVQNDFFPTPLKGLVLFGTWALGHLSSWVLSRHLDLWTLGLLDTWTLA